MLKLDLQNFAAYQRSLVVAIETELKIFAKPLKDLSLDYIHKHNDLLLAHPGVAQKNMDISPIIFDPKNIDISRAQNSILQGKVFWEHTAAGEATRLGLGTKYLLNSEVLKHSFQTHSNFQEQYTDAEAAQRETLTSNELLQASALLSKVKPYNMGLRHLAQLAIDIRSLALSQKLDPDKVLAQQTNMLILNEHSAEQVIQELLRYNFLGFSPDKTFFMVQRSGHGYSLDEQGHVFLNPHTEKRLYNHGAMRQQTIMDNEVFFFCDQNRLYLAASEFLEKLKGFSLLFSSNIEDLDWLECALDLPAISFGLALGEAHYEMIMTAVKQKIPPQKGGFFCELHGRTICLESDSDPEMFHASPEYLRSIKYLNKNMNMYPNPYLMAHKLQTEALPLHLTVKGGAIYPQTPQGDLNFVLKTAVIQEVSPRPIRNLKTQKDILQTLLQFQKQDKSNLGDYLVKFS